MLLGYGTNNNNKVHPFDINSTTCAAENRSRRDCVKVYNNDGLADLIEANLSSMGRRMLVAQLGEVSTNNIIQTCHMIASMFVCRRFHSGQPMT